MPLHLLLYVIAGVLLLVEAFTPGTFIFVCFAVASFITGLVAQFTPIDITWLLALDLVLSVLCLFIVRPLLQMVVKIPADHDPRNFGTYAEKLIGREAMVFKTITKAEPGVVKLLDFDETWLANSVDGSEIGQGTSVKIVRLDGNHLVVSCGL